MAVSNEWEVHHLDVKCAYLYGDLVENVYMKALQGYNKSNANVVKLKRPIYGLKQSGRNWNNEINGYLIDSGLNRLKCNNCTYTYGDDLILIIYVNDIVVFTKNMSSMNKVKDILMSKYEIKDLGRVSYLLGIKIEYKDECMELSQRVYIDKLLNEYNMNECKCVKTPIEVGMQLSENNSPQCEEDRKEMMNVPYRRLIGSLLYIALATRPDIMYAVIKMSQNVSDPGKTHWIQVKRILRYLKATKDCTLMEMN